MAEVFGDEQEKSSARTEIEHAFALNDELQILRASRLIATTDRCSGFDVSGSGIRINAC